MQTAEFIRAQERKASVLDQHIEAVWLSKYTAPKMSDTTLSLINQDSRKTAEFISLSNDDVNKSSDFGSIQAFFEAKKVKMPTV